MKHKAFYEGSQICPLFICYFSSFFVVIWEVKVKPTNNEGVAGYLFTIRLNHVSWLFCKLNQLSDFNIQQETFRFYSSDP